MTPVPTRPGARVIVVVAAIVVLVTAGVVAAASLRSSGSEGEPEVASPNGTALESEHANPAPDPPNSGTNPVTGVDSAAVDTAAVVAVAERVVVAINTRDQAVMKALSCDPDTVGRADAAPPSAHAELVAQPELAGDTATVQVRLVVGDASTVTPVPLRKKDGGWCVD